MGWAIPFSSNVKIKTLSKVAVVAPVDDDLSLTTSILQKLSENIIYVKMVIYVTVEFVELDMFETRNGDLNEKRPWCSSLAFS